MLLLSAKLFSKKQLLSRTTQRAGQIKISLPKYWPQYLNPPQPLLATSSLHKLFRLTECCTCLEKKDPVQFCDFQNCHTARLDARVRKKHQRHFFHWFLRKLNSAANKKKICKQNTSYSCIHNNF